MDRERRKRGRIRARPPSWGATFDGEFSSAGEQPSQRDCVKHVPDSDLALGPSAGARRTEDTSLQEMCVNFGANQDVQPDLSHVSGLGRTLCVLRPRLVFTAAAAAVLLGLLAPVRTSAAPVGPALVTPPAAAPDMFALDPLGGQTSAELEAALLDGGRRRLASTVCPTCPNLARSCSGASADPTLGEPACITTLTNPITFGGNTYYGYYGVDGNSATQSFQTTGSGFREWNVTFQATHNIIEEVFVYNLDYSGSGTNYAARLNGAKLEVVHVNDTVVASRTLTGDPGLQVYTFSEMPVGSRVSINKNVANGQNLHVKEVEVYGRAVNRVFVTSTTPGRSPREPSSSAPTWDPALFASTSTIKFSRGFLYGIMIMFASVAMLLVARPGSYRAFWRRLPCSKYEVKLETNRAVITKTCFTTAVDESPVAHIFVHENVHEQDETYTQMSSSQFGLSAVEVGSSIMMPPVKHEQKKRNSMDFFKNKSRHDGDDSPNQSPRSSSKRRPSMDFFKRNSKEDVMAEPKAHAESSSRSVHFMID